MFAPPRVALREFDWTDVHAVHAYASDPRVVFYEPWGPNSDVETHAFLQQAIQAQDDENRRHFDWAVQEIETGRLIGAGSIHVSSHELREAYLGYVLHRERWGQGLGTEVATLLLNQGFQKMGLHRIYALVHPDNQASRRILEKIGLRQETHFRHNRWVKGAWRDTVVYACLEDDERPFL